MSVRSSNRDSSALHLSAGGLRYVAELAVGVLLFCITLHTFFLAGLIVPVTVSGGSMAKSILGPRIELYCDDCGIKVACGSERLPADGTAYCLNCGWKDLDLNSGTVYSGERTLIDRTSLTFNPPYRWEVIVFRCPEQPEQFCIKRVVGLPGEEVSIHAGDVFIDGKIVRKSLGECLEAAQLVNDASYSFGPRLPDGKFSYWLPLEENSNWHLMAGKEPTFYLRTKEGISSEIQWLGFHPQRNGLVTDDYDYNQSESRRLNPVTDLMLSCGMGLADTEEFYVRSNVSNDQFELIVSSAEQKIQLIRGGEKLAESTVALDSFFSTWLQLQMVRFDRQILVTINDQLVLSYPYEPHFNLPAEQEEPSPPWSIGMRTGRMRLKNLQILRDIYYTVPTASRYAWGSAGPVKLAEDEYFVLGDNSPISADSRIWPRPGIQRKSFVGRLLGTW